MPDTLLALGFDKPVRLAAASPSVVIGDPFSNAESVIRQIRRASEAGADYLALPELCLSGATLGTLLTHRVMLDAATEALNRVCEATRTVPTVCSVGLPYIVEGTPRSCIALISSGRVLAIIPACGSDNPFGFIPEIARCTAERTPLTPVSRLAAGFGGKLFARAEPREGYTMLVSSCFNATAKSYDELKRTLESYSARSGMAVAFASPGKGESTTSFVFDGLCAIAANGELIAVSTPLEDEPFVCADVLPETLSAFEPFDDGPAGGTYVSSDEATANGQLERILSLEAAALARRAEHIGCRGFVVGVSGGLDSALALLASATAGDRLGIPRENTLGVSMPGFGTSNRTKGNSEKLVRALGCEYREISVTAACRQHFADIGHDESVHDSVYENAQARERTKILLSIANGERLLDVGTGDLSEAALGWTTFGGDHLAQYGVNASVPKTVIRRVVARAKERFPEAADVLQDILDTPVSPELLPPVNGVISQRTEELVGSYELHDFFIWRFINGDGPKDLFEAACRELPFEREEIHRVLGIFLRRFFSEEYKRNCAPEAPAICLSIAPSSFTMPSDAACRAFLREYEKITL